MNLYRITSSICVLLLSACMAETDNAPSSSSSSSSTSSSSSSSSSSSTSSSSSSSSTSSSSSSSGGQEKLGCASEISEGKKLYAEECSRCHGDVPDGRSIWVGPRDRRVDVFDDDQDGYTEKGGSKQFEELNTFIAMYMPDTNNGIGLGKANQITAFMTDRVGRSWCPGEVWPPELGEMKPAGKVVESPVGNGRFNDPKSSWPLKPDSIRQAGVPRGKLEKRSWSGGQYFPENRNYWVYVPQQYKPSKPAALLVWFDGELQAVMSKGRTKPLEGGDMRVPIVLDNLIHKKELPVTIGVFINPGKNRGLEYDSLGNKLAKFLDEEILPEALKGLNVTSDPNGRAIGGNSSGGIAAFTVGWEMPDKFRLLLTHNGSFVNLKNPGGGSYPGRILAAEKKPLRVFLQTGAGDIKKGANNWPAKNIEMFEALDEKGYDVRFMYGESKNATHGPQKGGASYFPDTIRWAFDGYPITH